MTLLTTNNKRIPDLIVSRLPERNEYMKEREQTYNSAAELWIENGIVCARYKTGTLLDLDLAKDCIRIRLTLQDGKTMPLLLDITGLREITKAARAYLSSDYALTGTSAGVLLTNSSIFVITLANIYFTLAKPQIPHRLFADREKALDWLHQFK